MFVERSNVSRELLSMECWWLWWPPLRENCANKLKVKKSQWKIYGIIAHWNVLFGFLQFHPTLMTTIRHRQIWLLRRAVMWLWSVQPQVCMPVPFKCIYGMYIRGTYTQLLRLIQVHRRPQSRFDEKTVKRLSYLEALKVSQ